MKHIFCQHIWLETLRWVDVQPEHWWIYCWMLSIVLGCIINSLGVVQLWPPWRHSCFNCSSGVQRFYCKKSQTFCRVSLVLSVRDNIFLFVCSPGNKFNSESTSYPPPSVQTASVLVGHLKDTGTSCPPTCLCWTMGNHSGKDNQSHGLTGKS